MGQESVRNWESSNARELAWRVDRTSMLTKSSVSAAEERHLGERAAGEELAFLGGSTSFDLQKLAKTHGCAEREKLAKSLSASLKIGSPGL